MPGRMATTTHAHSLVGCRTPEESLATYETPNLLQESEAAWRGRDHLKHVFASEPSVLGKFSDTEQRGVTYW